MAGTNSHGAEPHNPHVHYEPGDVNARALSKFGLTMGVLVLFFMFGLYFVFRYFVEHEAEIGQPASRAALVNPQKQPPEPRLQQYPARDMRDWRAKEDRILHQYAWIDPDKGIVQIPIDRAMDLLAQRGLPVEPPGKKQ